MKPMYDNLTEYNARKFARLPVDAFIKTMVLAMAGFSLIYLVVNLGIYYLGGDWILAWWGYPLGLAGIGLSWLPFSIIKTTIPMMPQMPFKIVLTKKASE